MKKLFFNLMIGGLICGALACNSNTQDTAEEGKVPVSAEDPKAPKVAPDAPATDVGTGLDSLKTELEADTL